LLSRINGHLGRVVVERLRFVQDAVLTAPPVAELADAPPPPVIEGVPDGPLHDALVRLGRAVQRASTARLTKR
jgi:hypothetical protein